LVHVLEKLNGETVNKRTAWCLCGFILASGLIACAQSPAAPVHVIEVLADKDSRYKIAGEKKPEITVKVGESILLRITARKGKSWNRDGSVHGFSLLRAKDRSKVSGWDLLLKPGTQEFPMTAPDQPGEYVVVCTVICSEEHEGMLMKFVVTP
jgi:heme/copper-type cytochrome/quinol oxidase subunit 2